MRYNEIVPAIFKKRVNRFIAEVWLNGELERVHVKNTGRLKELLLPEREVYLEIADNPNRKTKYSLIAVNRDGNLVNVDSQAQNIAAFEAIQSGKIKEIGKPEFLKKEVTFQSSRFDLYFEDGDTKGFIEVKGVTLSKDGVAMFPDAPTSRGAKHIKELEKAVQAGYRALVLFIVQMKGNHVFTPNWEMDPAFSESLVQAAKAGVEVLAYDCQVQPDGFTVDRPLPVQLAEADIIASKKQ